MSLFSISGINLPGPLRKGGSRYIGPVLQYRLHKMMWNYCCKPLIMLENLELVKCTTSRLKLLPASYRVSHRENDWCLRVFFWSVLVMVCGLCYRVLLDRAHTDLDSVFHSLDSDPEPEPLVSSPPSSPLRSSNASTSETNTSDPSNTQLPSSSSPLSSRPSVDLSQILLNIKSCRWRHFRPRTLSHHPLGGGDFPRQGFRGFNRTSLGLARTPGAGANSQSRSGPAATPVNGESVLHERLKVIQVVHFSNQPDEKPSARGGCLL